MSQDRQGNRIRSALSKEHQNTDTDNNAYVTRQVGQNGKAERFNRTLQEGWTYKQPCTSNQERTDALQHWLDFYNCQRAHSALGGKTPISRCKQPSSVQPGHGKGPGPRAVRGLPRGLSASVDELVSELVGELVDVLSPFPVLVSVAKRPGKGIGGSIGGSLAEGVLMVQQHLSCQPGGGVPLNGGHLQVLARVRHGGSLLSWWVCCGYGPQAAVSAFKSLYMVLTDTPARWTICAGRRSPRA
jgi:Integrase core domain